MPVYYYFLPIVFLGTAVIAIHFFILQRKNIPFELYSEALKNENDGQFEAAVITYRTALDEVKKARFGNSSLRNRILEKLKVLHTNIAYRNSFEFKRGDNN
jgi:hypothetical protein